MAKFKIRASLVSIFRAKKVLNPETDTMKIRVPYKEHRITGDRCFEMNIGPDDVVETSNDFSTKVLANIYGPKIRQGSGWLITDPTISWLETVAAGTPTTILLTDTDEILTFKHRTLVERYASELHLHLPRPLLKDENEILVAAARAHFAQKGA